MSDTEEKAQFEALLDYLKRNRGFDFTGYKHSSLMRRIRNRMERVGIAGFGDYMDYLEVHPEEFEHLFNTILINVTAFFRDAPAWDYLASDVLPRILVDRRPGDPIRVWSAGCASGEEAYSLAMVLAEALGLQAFRDRVKIYGTDVDLQALNQARQAAYTAKQVEGVPPALLEKYFEHATDRYVFHQELRRSVIFGRHDVIQDAPISRLDLLVCRNILMYFNAETQARILDRFHFALREGGFLFLGKAEMLLTRGNTFTPVDLKRRFFTKVPRGSLHERIWNAVSLTGSPPANSPLLNHVRIREVAFDTASIPQVVVDANGFLALANSQARAQFGLTATDLGRPLQDLELSYRPVELRSCIEQACAERRAVTFREVEWRTSTGAVVYLDVQVAPLADNGGGNMGVSITFTDVTAQRRLQEELQRAYLELEAAYQKLQHTNEELETTNEELQSTNEELETTNEELQSTNEELETMNEELQSANEELQTMNEELRQRSDEFHQVNGFLESILASLRNGVIVLDQDLLVLMWNRRAEDLWGLRAEEVRGKHFFNLDFGLPVEQLRPTIKSCLADGPKQRELWVDAVNRRGKPIQCKVTFMPLANSEADKLGVILLMEEQIDVDGHKT